MNQKTVLVTGGAGFIGSHLVDKLVSTGYRVVVLDNLSEGKLKNVNKNVHFHHIDLNVSGIHNILEQEKPDFIFHHAAQISIPNSVKDPVADAQTNILSTVRLLQASKDVGVGKIIFASTGGAIYGNPERLPCPETEQEKPLSPYSLSKAVSEKYFRLFEQLYRLNYTILRYGNVYGPRQDSGGESGVIAIFIKKMLEKEQPRINGDGNQLRDFIYIDDIIEANLLAMNSGNRETINIGSGVGTSIINIFKILSEIIKFKWEPLFGPAKPGEVESLYLDIVKAKKELKWEPKFSLEKGLKLTVDYMKNINEEKTNYSDIARRLFS